MKPVYKAKDFHWSYPLNAILLPVIALMWCHARLEGFKVMPFKKVIKATLFNKHTCEFSETITDNDHRKCKNELCNIVTIQYTNGLWIDERLNRIQKELQK